MTETLCVYSIHEKRKYNIHIKFSRESIISKITRKMKFTHIFCAILFEKIFFLLFHAKEVYLSLSFLHVFA